MKRILNHYRKKCAMIMSLFLLFGLFTPVYAEDTDLSEDLEAVSIFAGNSADRTLYFYVNPDLSFVSSDPSVATASQTGSSLNVSTRVYYGSSITIRAYSKGEARIDVYNRSTKVKTYKVSVTPLEVYENVHIGQTREYDFITQDYDGIGIDNENIKLNIASTAYSSWVNGKITDSYVSNHVTLSFPSAGSYDFVIRGAKSGTLCKGHVDVSDHIWDSGTVIQNPTCTDDGIRRYTCTDCGATKDEVIHAIGGQHNWNEVLVNPTCNEDGWKQSVCTRCGQIKEEIIPATGHNLVKTEAKEPTKLEDGNIEYWTCLNDGKIYSDANAEYEINQDQTILPNVGEPYPFIDVNDHTPHENDIVWMYNSEVSEGWIEENGTRTYRPMNSVVRQDMAAFLRREAKKLGVSDAATWKPDSSDWNTFTDVNYYTPHAEDILWLAHAGISTGWTEADGSKTYRGMDTVKRQDMAAFLHRLANIAGVQKSGMMSFTDVNNETPHADDIHWLGGTGISTGYSDGTYQGMWPVYRQDMAAFIHRLDNLQ